MPSLSPMTPRSNQEAAIRAILADKAHISKADVGSGKTLVGVEAALRSGVDVILVIAPLNTRKGWQDTFERQSQGTVKFQQITSSKDGKKAFEDFLARVPGAYFIGWERFRMFSWAKMQPDFIIADEVHRQANRKSKIALMMNTTSKVQYKLALSATPAGNKIEGLWQSIKWLWPDETKAFWPWVTEWMKTERDPYVGKKIMGERNPGALWASLPSKSSFPSPYQTEPIIHTVEVDMTPAQQKIYDRFEKEAVVWLDDNPLIAELPAVQQMRLRQITMAVPSIRFEWQKITKPEDYEFGKRETKFDEHGCLYEQVEIVYFEDDAKSSKADAVLEILSDLYAGTEKPPVLIFTHSRKFATMLTKRLQEKKYNARQFVGGMTPHERQWKLDNFGVEYDILVATISAIGTGTDGLQKRSNIEFWVSVEDNRILNTQAKGRLSRVGQEKTVQRYLIRARNSVEVRQAGRLATDEALMAESLNNEQRAA